MISYEDGTAIKAGDKVGFEEGRFEGIVELVVDTSEAQNQIGVDGPGIMLKAPEFGRVFLPVKFFSEHWPVRMD